MFNYITQQEFLGRNSTAATFFEFDWDGTRSTDNGVGNGDHRKVLPNGRYILKLSVLPTQFASIAEFVRAWLGGKAGWQLLMYSTGLAWLRIDSAESEQIAGFLAVLRAFLAPTGGHAALLQASPELRQKVDIWGDAGSALPLMMRIKQQFDPRGILNRARFVGGI